MVAIVVVIVVLLSMLVWMNLLWLRPNSSERKPKDSSQTKANAPEPQTSGPLRSRRASAKDQTDSQDTVQPSAPLDFAAPSEETGTVGTAHTVEVVHDEPQKQKSVFERPLHPFKLFEHQVPAFAEDKWQNVFLQLTEDDLVLGWIAFSGESVGACDREYDQPFLEVLRSYRRTVEKLRREVGMASIHETSIVGDEGQVWMITAVDDAWLALFMDRQTDAASVTARMLDAVRQGSDAK